MMKRIFVFLAVTLFFNISLNSEEMAVDGGIIKKNGDLIKINTLHLNTTVEAQSLRCTYNGVETRVKVIDLLKIRVLSGSLNTQNNTVLEFHDGRSFEVERASWLSGSLHNPTSHDDLRFKVFDGINQKYVASDIAFSRIKEIIFDNIGDSKVDPENGQNFPPDYIYNPYTGTKLIPGFHGSN